MQLVVAHEGPEVQLGGGPLELLYFGLVLLVLAQLLVKTALALHGVETVVAGVELRVPVHYLNAALGHGVQEVAVVADGQHRAAEVQYVVLQPLRGAQVQVVGGLVEKEDVGVLQDEAGQVHARLLAAAELVELALAHRGRDVEAVGHAVALPVHIVPAQAAEVVAEAVVLVEQGL